MVSYDKVQAGIARYLDTELVTKLDNDSVQKVIVGVVISLYIKKFSDLIMMAKDNKVVKTLGIVDDKGNIDVDTLKDEIERQIPDSGLKVDIPMVGLMTFHKSDVQTLYKYIVGDLV